MMVGSRKLLAIAALVAAIASAVVVSAPAVAAPNDAPVSCTFTRDVGVGFDVAWQPVGGVDKFIVRRSVGQISSNSEPYWRAAPGAGQTAWSDSGAVPSAEIQYFVSTKTGSQESTLTACQLLAPTGVTATATGTAAVPRVSVSWLGDPDASQGYNVYNGAEKVNAAPVLSTSFEVNSGLIDSGRPAFSVTALSRDPRNAGTIVESDRSVADGAPGVPSLTNATGSNDGSLVLRWSAVADAQLGYRVFRDGQYFGTFPSTEAVIERPGNQGQLALGRHRWTVSAQAFGGYLSAESNRRTVTVTDAVRPDPPGGLFVAAQNATTVTLEWNPPDQTQSGSMDPSGFVSYRVFIDDNPAGNRSGFDTLVATSNTASAMVDRAVVVGDLYVTVTDGAGNESYISNKIALGDLADSTRPTRPLRFDVNANVDGTHTFTWTASTDNVGVTSYRVLKDDNPNRNGRQFDTTVATTSATSVTTTLEPGSSTLYVMAYDAAGNQSWRSRMVTVAVDSTDQYWRTGQDGNGIWQIYDPNGSVVQWQAANIKDNSVGGSNGIDSNDIANFSGVFDTVRLALRWDRLQPTGPNSLSVTRTSEVLGLLDQLEAAGVDVILDPVHLSGSDAVANAFAIPDWAWTGAGVTGNAQRLKANSFNAWAGNNAQRVKAYLDELTDAGILTHAAVIAVEVVNEPHPLAADATASVGQQRLAAIHQQLVAHIQALQAAENAKTRLVIVGAYFGGLRHGGVRTNDAFAFNHHDTEVSAQNVIWTAHNYYTGVGDTEGINDGQANNGQRDRGYWAEGSTSAGCYGGPPIQNRSNVWSCAATPQNRTTAQQGHRLNAQGHFDYAQDAGMPFFMGEWGLTRQRYQSAEYRGWDHAEYFYCDKLAAYSDVDGNGTSISWAVWSLDANTDGFGLYYARNTPESAQSHRSYLSPNTWVSTGAFGAESAGWSADAWTYARPFIDAGYCNQLG